MISLHTIVSSNRPAKQPAFTGIKPTRVQQPGGDQGVCPEAPDSQASLEPTRSSQSGRPAPRIGVSQPVLRPLGSVLHDGAAAIIDEVATNPQAYKKAGRSSVEAGGVAGGIAAFSGEPLTIAGVTGLTVAATYAVSVAGQTVDAVSETPVSITQYVPDMPAQPLGDSSPVRELPVYRPVNTRSCEFNLAAWLGF